MKHKCIFVIVFLLTITVPFLINNFVNESSGLTLQTENRTISKFKPLEGYKIRDFINFFENFDQYIADHLISRDFLVKNFKNITDRYPFKLTFPNNIDNGVIGKDNFVFLSNNNSGKGALDRHLIGNPSNFAKQHPNYAEMHNDIHFKIKELNNFTKKIQSDFFLLVAPDKLGVYCHKLPIYLGYNPCKNARNITDHYIQELKRSNVNNIFYPINELQKIAKNQQIFFKTDSHWNLLGAEKTFDLFINYIKQNAVNIDKEQIKLNKNYSLLGFKNHNYGDLKNIASLSDYFHLDEIAYDLKTNPQANIYWKSNANDQKKIVLLDRIRSDAYENFEEMYNHQAPNNLKVLIIHDSFTVNLSVFFNLNFKKVVYMTHYNNYRSKEKLISEVEQKIKELKPNIVIFEVIERYF